MAETLYATSSLAGTCSTPDNALGAADDTWTDNADADDWSERWAMGDPSGGLDSGTQTIEVAGRKSTAGAGGDPVWQIDLYENGSLVASAIGSGSLTTDTGTLTATFNGSQITNEANVQILISATANGGGPNECTLQVDEIKWTAVTASAAYTLPADYGSYVASGQALSLLKDSDIAASQGVYAVSGQSAGLLKDTIFAAAQGAYALAGQEPALVRTRLIAASQGAYALAGQVIIPIRHVIMNALDGSYTLSGQPAALVKGRTLIGENGIYALQGQAIALGHDVLHIVDMGSYAVSGRIAMLLRDASFAAADGAYALSGQDTILTKSSTFQGEQGSYAVSGIAVNLERDAALLAVDGNYALTGQAASFLEGGGNATLSAAYGAYAVSGQDVGLQGVAYSGLESYLKMVAWLIATGQYMWWKKSN